MKIIKPPYTITDKMLNLVSEIMGKIDKAKYFEKLINSPDKRRKTQIHSIHSSLAIENNQLSFFEVEAVINGKSVIGDKKDIQEVKNAYNAYEQIDNMNPYSIEDLKKIQGLLTFAIEKNSGEFRNHGEAVYDGDVQIFMAPHNMVPQLMKELFDWMKKEKDNIYPLILSSIFHYEFVFIHPFSDGNGRTARLWQTIILSHWKEIFKYVQIETIIKNHQKEYYDVIQKCNNNGTSNDFIEFMLEIILEAINNITTQETTQEKILSLIKENPSITQIEMSNRLGITRDGISYNIRILKDNKIIKREGSTKKGYWIILK